MQNIEIHYGFVNFLVIRDLVQIGGAAENLYNSVPFGLLGITHVVLQNAIFAEKSRVAGDPDRGGPVGASRASLR